MLKRNLVILSTLAIATDQFFKFFSQIHGFSHPNPGLIGGLHLINSLVINLGGLIFIGLLLINNKSYYQSIAYLLMFLGGLSNLFDRVLYRNVIDYISLFNLSYYNLADIYLVCGAIILVISLFKQLIKPVNEKQRAKI